MMGCSNHCISNHAQVIMQCHAEHGWLSGHPALNFSYTFIDLRGAGACEHERCEGWRSDGREGEEQTHSHNSTILPQCHNAISTATHDSLTPNQEEKYSLIHLTCGLIVVPLLVGSPQLHNGTFGYAAQGSFGTKHILCTHKSQSPQNTQKSSHRRQSWSY